MVRRRPSRFALVVSGALLLSYVVWTALVTTTDVLVPLDRGMLAGRHSEDSPAGQVFAAFALLTWPGVIYAGLLGLAIWAGQRKLRNLAAALTLSVVFAWGGALVMKRLIARPRPDTALDVITAGGYAYPSSHQVAITAAVLAVAVTTVVTRQSRTAALGWRVGGLALVLAVALDRWWMGAHFVSDLIGGFLWGGFAASLAMVLCRVTVLPPQVINRYRRRKLAATVDGPDVEGEPPAVAAAQQRCAVVYNPSKIIDLSTFRRLVEFELSSRGWAQAIWLETMVDDAGRAMTATAVDQKVDLVLGAGGDGTIRRVCAGLADTGIPFGLIPVGTGNLLARNLGIPLDGNAALDVAFDGVDAEIDVVRLTVDDATTDDFMVMAGIGIDAVIMQTTDPNLKKAVGSAAYFVAAAQNAKHPALHATIQVDDDPPFKRKAHVIVVGNVGYLQANIPLIPDARADDGLIDLIVASPVGVRDWVRIFTQVMTRRRDDPQLDRMTGRRISITVDEGDHYQMDGDTEGHCHTMVAEVRPGALTIRMPRR
ncbi:MAG: diacylglycerol kinase family protein [Propionibacteriaceae bacterium]